MLFDAVIIGGGVVGCAVARYLSQYQLHICLLEQGEDVCVGTSRANSAIIHAGFDAMPGSRKAFFNVQGSRMMESLSRELDFPYRRNGALVLCFSEGDMPRLRELHQRGKKNHVHGLTILWGEALRKKEPAISPDVYAALYAPTSAVTCPFSMTYAMAENAAANGCVFQFDTRVDTIERSADHFVLHTSGGDVACRTVISAAGVYGDEIHNQLCESKIRITPRRGEYCLLDKKDSGLLHHTIFQLPGAKGKGVLVTPTTSGNILIGPTATDQLAKDYAPTTAEGLAYLEKTALYSVPDIPFQDTITAFAGLRAHITEGAADFIVGESAPGFFEAAGIESPGLSAAPAIGVYLAEAVAKKLGAAKKECFTPGRRGIPRLREMPFSIRAALVAANPVYGNIVCRCEQISEGEILDAIHRTPGARSMDGVKRRVRAGMGRCQGGFCSPKVLDLLSRELHIPREQFTKSGHNSFFVVEKSKEAGK